MIAEARGGDDSFYRLSQRALYEEMSCLRRMSSAPRLRTMRQFATDEIVLPDDSGPFANQRFRVERQPYAGLLLDEIDSGRWHRYAFCGPVQSGKTLSTFVIPICYHLFEMREDVGAGIPTMDMAGDKWRDDILPVIQRSRYRTLIPETGIGSRGGKFESITFRNGVTLKFLSGGGGDEKRSGWTTRVIIITEADKLDETSETSREADKITQMEGRTRSRDWGQTKISMECTVSIEQGRIWQEYQKGSCSQIFCGCPYGRHWVHPTRECLMGWQEASDELEAFQKSFFACPECGGCMDRR